MSYLLDALRKAERERNLGRVPELTYAANDTVAVAGKRVPIWVLAVVIGLVVLNMVVLATFWWMGRDKPVSTPAENPPVIQAQQAQKAPIVASESVKKSTPIPKPKPAPTSAPVQAAGEPEFNAVEPEAPETLPPNNPKIEHYNALSAGQRNQLPKLNISGHLYSSIPGRSFVLVNGRRYHEGQRLTEGPAIMLIDEEGAVFNYHDIRYRLDAPR